MPAAPIRRPPEAWAVATLHWYIRRLASRRFHAWHWAAADEPALRDTQRSLLFLANHSAWWDGFFAFALARVLGHDLRLLMQADQLVRYRFFARCGAVSLDRAHPRQAYDDLRHAATLLAPGRGVWLFPQGRLASPYERPLQLEGGAARLAAWAAPLRIVPVGFRYVFLAHERPEAFAYFGAPLDVEAGAERQALAPAIRRGLETTLETLDHQLQEPAPAGFQRLFPGRPSKP